MFEEGDIIKCIDGRIYKIQRIEVDKLFVSDNGYIFKHDCELVKDIEDEYLKQERMMIKAEQNMKVLNI